MKLNIMKQISLFVPAMLAFLGAYAQQDTTVYFNSKSKTVSRRSEAEMYIHYVKQPSGCFRLEMRKVDGDSLVSEGYCLTPDSMSRNGHFIFYQNGRVSSEGDIINNKEEGEWKYYHKDSHKLWYVENMKKGLNDGKLTSYYENGKLKREEVLKDGVSISGKCYDENGNEITFTPFKTMPAPSFNMVQYLSENVHYPEKARRKGIEGRVKVNFVVNEDGSIDDVEVIQRVGGGCDEEAVRVIKDMTAWKPGIIDDKKVKVRYTQPIRFKLE